MSVPPIAASSTIPPRTWLWRLTVASIALLAVALEYPRAAALIDRGRVLCDDPDDYTRLFRARQIMQGETRLVGFMPELNAPRGVVLHWTAPMDYLVATAGRLTAPFTDFPDPLALGAAFVPPLLGAAYVVCMMTFVAACAGRPAGVLAGLMIAVSPAFHRPFAFAHPDHHCLLEFLFAIGLFVLVPSRNRPVPSRRRAVISGLAIGLAIWVAVQAMLFWFAILIGLTAATITGNFESRIAWSRVRQTWALSVAVVVVLGHFVENSPHLDVAALDKIGSAHLLIVTLAVLIPQIGPSASRATDTRFPASARFALFIASCAGCAAWLFAARHRLLEYTSRPEFFRWSKTIAELQPLFTRTTDDAFSLARLHARIGMVAYALPLLLVPFVRTRGLSIALLWTLGLFAPLLAILTIFQLRWLDHFDLFVAPVCAIGLWQIVQPRIGSTELAMGTALLLLAGIMHPAGGNIVSRTTAGERQARKLLDRTAFVADSIRGYDAKHPDSPAPHRAILSDESDGPMLLYFTGHPIVAAPYHRALDGIIESAAFFAERDPVAARGRLDRLGVRYVVVPVAINEQLMNFERLVYGELRSYDPPIESIDDQGRLKLRLQIRPEAAQTMAYRLSMTPGNVIPGVRLIGRIREGAPTPDGLSGLLYVVGDGPRE